MVLEDIQLPRCVALPFPPDNAMSAISEWFTLTMTPITGDVLRRNSNRPPDTLENRLYQNCRKQLYDPSAIEIKKRQKKVADTLEMVRKDVMNAVKKFRFNFLHYNKMIKDNEENTKKYRETSVERIKKIRELIGIHRRQMKANHTLLYVKDALEEAVANYEEAEVFLKKVGKESYFWKTPESIQHRYSTLIKMKKDLEREINEESKKCAKLLDEMFQAQEEAHATVSLLLVKARHLDRVIQDIDDRIVREEEFLVDVQAANEQAWREYSLINMTIFDLTRSIVEMQDYDPSILKSSLWERLEFIRREHLYNKEILRRWGQKPNAATELIESALGEKVKQRRLKRSKLEEEKKLRKVKEFCRKHYKRKLPKKLNDFLRLMHVRQKGFPPPEEAFEYICSTVGVGNQKRLFALSE